MRLRVFLLFPLLFIGILLQAQNPLPIKRSAPSVLARDANVQGYQVVIIPVVPDTASALTYGVDSLGMLIQVRATGKQYKRDTVPTGGHVWTEIGSSSGSTYTADESSIHLSTGQFSIKGTYPGQSTITTLGTIGTGIWQGTAIGDTYISSAATWNAKLSAASTTNTVTGNGTSGSPVQLVGDAASPGNSMYYGTNGSGAKGFYTLPSGVAAANPTTSIGLTPTNGSATTFMRSDAAQSLSQAIIPTWSAQHTFGVAPIFSTLTGYLKGNSSSQISAATTIPNTDVSGLGTAATKNVPASGNAAAGEVVLGSDSRLTSAAAFDSATSQVTAPNAFHTEGWYQAHYMQIKDSVRYATFARLYKTLDSISGVYLKNGDSTRYATFQRLYKVADSIGNIYVKRGDSTLYATFARLYKVADSLGGLIHSIAGGSGYSPKYDLDRMPRTRYSSYGMGFTASHSVTNYPAAGIDSSRFPFSTVGTGNYFGGWIFPGTFGDSVSVKLMFGVVIGDSQAAGHPGHNSRLEQVPYNYQYNDQVDGTIAQRLSLSTHFKWYNHGIGGQTSRQVLERWDRDALGASTAQTPAQTLSSKPDFIVIIVGINDFFNGILPAETKANLEFFAASCQQNNIHCIIWTLPGDEISSGAQLKQIQEVNSWLRKGALDKYNAGIWDFNQRVWNDPSVNNNWKRGPWGADDVHQSSPGYDTAADRCFRDMHIPVLDTLEFRNPLNPTTPVTNLAEPATVSINGVNYTVPSSNKIPITAYIGGTYGTYTSGDTVTILVNSARTLTGAGTQTGIGQVVADINNDPGGTDTLVTRRRNYYNGNLDPWYRTITTKSSTAAQQVFFRSYNATNADWFYLSGSGGGSFGIVNGAASQTRISNAIWSAYAGAGSVGFGTDGQYYGGGSHHQFGNMEINSNLNPGTTGYGISVNNSFRSGIGMFFAVNPTATNVWDYEYGYWTSTAKAAGAVLMGHYHFGSGWGSFNTTNQTAYGFYMDPTINQTASFPSSKFVWFRYRPTITALTGSPHYSIWTDQGIVALSTNADQVIIGDSLLDATDAKLQIKGKVSLNVRPDSSATPDGGLLYLSGGNHKLTLGPVPGGTVVTNNVPLGSAALGAAAGSGGSINLSINGYSLGGFISITTGNSPTTGTLLTVTLGAGVSYANNTLVNLMPQTAATSAIMGSMYVGSGGTNQFIIQTSSALTANTTYTWQYQVSGF